MDTPEPQRGASEEVEVDEHSPPASPTEQLPDDLPKSLDDRRSVPVFHETEMYDAWQGVLYFGSPPSNNQGSRATTPSRGSY
jgi:hypothetical protein